MIRLRLGWRIISALIAAGIGLPRICVGMV